MNFSQLKTLLQCRKIEQFQAKLEASKLGSADYNILLREIIKQKINHAARSFHILVTRGADVNFCQSGGDKKSNLMVACQQGTSEIVELLCEAPNINFEITDFYKKTAPYYAIANKNKNDGQHFLQKILMKAPHLVNTPANGQTMLLLAIKKQKPQIVKILLKYGADPNFVIDDSGNTALHEILKLYKAKQTKVTRQIVKLLLKNGADPKIKNRQGKNSFEYGDKFPWQEVMQQVGFDINNIKQDQNKVKLTQPPTKIDQNIRKTQSKQNIKNITFQNKNDKKKVYQKTQKTRYDQRKYHVNVQSQRNLIKKYSQQFSAIQKPTEKSLRNITIGKQFGKSAQSQRQPEQQDFQADSESFKNTDKQEISDSSSQDEFDQTDDKSSFEPFIQSNQIFYPLSRNLIQFCDQCEKNYQLAQKETQKFLNRVSKLASQENLGMQLYGSFRTGLWLKHCDIDIILIPTIQYKNEDNSIAKILTKMQQMLIAQGIVKNCIKNTAIRVPMLRLDVKLGKKIRKIDITVKDNHHNGLQIANYISYSVNMFKQVKPLFFAIKSLTYHYKLNDPKKGGIRTYGIIIMLLSFLQMIKTNQTVNFTLGQLLLRFLYYFGFEYQYTYGTQNDLHPQMPPNLGTEFPALLIPIPDPKNYNNNVGKNAKANQLQKMFKAAYIALHANVKGNRLKLMFDSKKAMLPL